MKKQYEEPQTEIIRYQAEDVILTSSHHHCGTGILTGHNYEDTTGDSYCDPDDNFHCGGGSGDISDEFCPGFCEETEGCDEVCGEYSGT